MLLLLQQLLDTMRGNCLLLLLQQVYAASAAAAVVGHNERQLKPAAGLFRLAKTVMTHIDDLAMMDRAEPRGW